MKKRDTWLDNAKFILIIAVILGHCIDKLGSGSFCMNSNAFMSFFRMPLFIFISGYFSKKTEWKRFLDFVLGIIETYLIMSMFHIVYYLLIGGHWSIHLIIQPRWTLWYLLSIIFWRLIIQISEGIIPGYLLVLLSIIVGILSGFVPLYSTLSLQRTLAFCPYFMIGYYCRTKQVNLRVIRKSPVLSVILLAGLFIIVSRTNFPVVDFTRGKYPFSYFVGFPVGKLLLYRVLMYVLSVIASAGILNLIPDRQLWISSQGKETLFYYLYHPLIIICLDLLSSHIAIPSTFIAMLLYTTVILFLIWLFLKVQFFRILPRLFTWFCGVFRNIVFRLSIPDN